MNLVFTRNYDTVSESNPSAVEFMQEAEYPSPRGLDPVKLLFK